MCEKLIEKSKKELDRILDKALREHLKEDRPIINSLLVFGVQCKYCGSVFFLISITELKGKFCPFCSIELNIRSITANTFNKFNIVYHKSI